MDNSLHALCSTLKKIITELNPKQNTLSFLVMTGKAEQGNTALLRQSQLRQMPVPAAPGSTIYYNRHGVLVNLGEKWLKQSGHLLAATLKQLNTCHRRLKISGLIACIDVNELLISGSSQAIERRKAHLQLINHFGQQLTYPVKLAFLLTKLDTLAGFSEFFQSEHAHDFLKPLGVSLCGTTSQQRVNQFKEQYDVLIAMLGQQIMPKIHAARSPLKRTLIREFPLQLANLRAPMQAFIQGISSPNLIPDTLYLTSAEQGGASRDYLNQKIQHEYALVVPNQFPQSTNHRAHFIDGALLAIQRQSKHQHTLTQPRAYEWTTGVLTATVTLALLGIGYQHTKSAELLEKTSQELVNYETLLTQPAGGTPSTYHLLKASASMEKATPRLHPLSATFNQLKTQLHSQSRQKLQHQFIPNVLNALENTIKNPSSAEALRYHALIIYQMLGNTTHFSQEDVLNWFSTYWKTTAPSHLTNNAALLKQIIQQPFQPLEINQQLVSDTQNYFNALPAEYLYYVLANTFLSQETTPIQAEGFELTTDRLPLIYTREGFEATKKQLPDIVKKLEQTQWALGTNLPANLNQILETTYYQNYAKWWQRFLRKTNPLRAQNTEQAQTLMHVLGQQNTFSQLIALIQQHTSPDLNDPSSLFNQLIANQFTELNLLSSATLRHLTHNFQEMEKLMKTLVALHDQGKTAFALTKSRFLGQTLSNPVSELYAYAQALPEPVSRWVNLTADDSWFILINQSRTYINQQWQTQIFQTYNSKLAERYPFAPNQSKEVDLHEFNSFLSKNGSLNHFINDYLKPFLDTSTPQWEPKVLNGYSLPVAKTTIDELIRANIITAMFFPTNSNQGTITFSLQKLTLDPIISNFQLTIGSKKLRDTQHSDSFARFQWPEPDATLALDSVEGNHYELSEKGPWAFFKLLQKINVLTDEQDPANLQVLFDINGNSGRYLLRSQNQLNPFTPGILNGFKLPKQVV